MSMIAGQVRKFREDDEERIPLDRIPTGKTVKIDLYGDNEVEYFTPQESTHYWRAAAWLGLPARMWRCGDPGCICMTDEARWEIRKQEISEADAFAIRDLLVTKAAVRADELFEGHDWLKIKVVEGISGNSWPSLEFDGTVALTPDVVTKKFGRGFHRWYVQSVDIDDAEDVFPNLDEALIRAAARALERKLRDKVYALNLNEGA